MSTSSIGRFPVIILQSWNDNFPCGVDIDAACLVPRTLRYIYEFEREH